MLKVNQIALLVYVGLYCN